MKQVSPDLLEGTFYWPVLTRCTENDKHTALDIMIIWRYISENTTASMEDTELFHTISSNITNITEKWLKIRSNCLANEDTKFYTLNMLRVVITQVWMSGFDILVIRNFYPVLVKASRDIEEMSGMGYKKLFYTRIVIIPTTIEVDGILRKRPISYYGVTIQVITRRTATIESLRDFMDTKEQVKFKERVLFFGFFEFYYKNRIFVRKIFLNALLE